VYIMVLVRIWGWLRKEHLEKVAAEVGAKIAGRFMRRCRPRLTTIV
jgi:predicted metal-dependent hydrolase